MEELWKQYDSKYEVSNLGRVRHIKYKKILKYNYPGNGTPQVKLSNHSTCVSHMVAKLFLGDRPDGHEIHHKDHNPSNNVVTNLEYKKTREHKTDHRRIRNRLRFLADNSAPNSFTLASHDELNGDESVVREDSSLDMVSSYAESRPCLDDDTQTDSMTAV